jgi:hypothetical protein
LSTGAFFASILEPIFYKRRVIWYELIFGVIVVIGLGIIFNEQLMLEEMKRCNSEDAKVYKNIMNDIFVQKLGIKEISEKSQLHPSTTHRILNDLVAGRYVDRPEPGHYRLGSGERPQCPDLASEVRT